MFIFFTNVLIGVMTYFPISVVSSIKGQAPVMANAVSFLAKKIGFDLNMQQNRIIILSKYHMEPHHNCIFCDGWKLRIHIGVGWLQFSYSRYQGIL